MTTETKRRDLAGLGVAVTGAAGDLGGAMALELAGRGARRDDARPGSARPRRPSGSQRSAPWARAPTGRWTSPTAPAVDAALAAIEPLDVAIGNAGHRRGGAVPRGLAGAVAGASRRQRDRLLQRRPGGGAADGSSGKRAARSSSRARGWARSRGPRSRRTPSRRRAFGCSRARWRASSPAAGSG